MKTLQAKLSNKKNPSINQSQVQWGSYIELFSKTPRNLLFNTISNQLLQLPLKTPQVIMDMVNQSSKDDFIKSVTIQLMSTPEYQMC